MSTREFAVGDIVLLGFLPENHVNEIARVVKLTKRGYRVSSVDVLGNLENKLFLNSNKLIKLDQTPY